MGLSNPQAVAELQHQLVEALQVQIDGNHASAAAPLMATLYGRIQELRRIGGMHRDFVMGCSQRWPDLCQTLPALYTEMMDITVMWSAPRWTKIPANVTEGFWEYFQCCFLSRETSW